MLKRLIVAGAVAIAAVVSGAGGADAAGHAKAWTLDGDASRVAFGSIKKDKVGETHSFSGLTGSVTAEGAVEIVIDLSSVETNIDIRNERMIEHVFKGAGAATITAQIDMDEVAGLAIGESAVVDAEGALSLIGTDVEIDAEMFVARIAEDRVLVSTNDMIFLSTEEAGITAGIDKLMELAKLPGITRTSPVTLRLIFQSEMKKAEAAPAAASVQTAAIAGDAKAGKKVFKKCKACHTVKDGANKVGPHLFGIIGRPAAAVNGFKYSKALKGADIVWTQEALAAFLADPKGYVPKNRMSYRGLKKDEDIQNVIAYLADAAK